FYAGIGAIYAAFFGIYMTIYGDTEKEIRSLQCLVRGFFITIWMHSDAAQVIFLIVASVNHLAAVLVPAKYAKVSSHCNGTFTIALLFVLSATLAIPVWISAVKEQRNSSVSAFCPLPDVIGDDMEEMHLQMRIWVPIYSLGILGITLFIFLIKQTKQSWRYAISENSPIDKQHFTCVLIRAILCALSVNLPFMFVVDKPISSTFYMNRDYISRLIYGISVCVCQPLIYFALLATFREDVNLVFKRYSHNTKRQW
uniref:G-protein coupled receptors family 1 profile domain-containing protein n=1 Tax=Parascaris univalens TaxID=6257 RepID=A0A915BA62_PARUN